MAGEGLATEGQTTAESKPGAVVFVHGIFGGAGTWSALLPQLQEDRYVRRFFDLELFTYPSPKFRFNPLKQIPDFGVVANSLITALQQAPRFKSRSCLVLVGHSQGGLIIQRMLVDAMQAGRANEDLARIRSVVLLATPNSGSELFLSVRGALDFLWHHPQEKTLRPFNEQIAGIHSALLERVVYAQRATANSRPIRFNVYTGDSDGVVPAHSARGMFPHTGTLPGDHSSIVQPTGAEALVVVALRQACHRAFNAVEPDTTVVRTEILDPDNTKDVQAAEAILAENFDASQNMTAKDFRYWLKEYEVTFGFPMRVIVARVNEDIEGALMFHESVDDDLIVIDYVASRKESGVSSLLFGKLVEQVRARAKSTGISSVVFEIEDPSTREGAEADRARARLRKFEALGARTIGGLNYVAPDMQDFGTAKEGSYLLMHVSSGLQPATLRRTRVQAIVRFLYMTYYSNWFSRRFAGREADLRNYVGGLYERVAGGGAKLPELCPLTGRSLKVGSGR
jgi:pimeloyl-ACP methyl ester carboxylesterase